MAGSYVVTAGGLVAKTASDTGEGYFYRGDTIPAGVPAKEIERLEGLGLIAQVKDDAPAAPASKAQK